MKMKRIVALLTVFVLTVCVCACGTADRMPQSEAERAESGGTVPYSENEPVRNDEKETNTAMKMNVQIGEQTFTATLEDNAAVRELVQLMRQTPISVAMRDYSGFEKVGPLGRSLPADDRQTTTAPGDIVLYSSDQIVMFYDANSWSYTRIGHIDNLTGWADALGDGDITAIFTLAE